MKSGRKKERIFLDHASTTPVDRRVAAAMAPFLSDDFANPAALYAEGVRAKEALEGARLEVARALQCKRDEIVFTGSGTESNNLAILGTLRTQWQRGRNHIVTTTIEHPAVLETCSAIEADGGSVTYVPVGEEGIVRAEDVINAVTERTALVSVMLANNEIGTIQPVGQIARLIKEYREKHASAFPYFHVDASQAANYIDCSPMRLGADLVTLDAQKIYGPKGVGVLYVKKGVEIAPLMYGGGQEKGLRPGTENVAGIVGFAKTLELTLELRESESERLTELRDYFIEEILKRIPNASLNGDRKLRLPNNINVCIPNLDGEFAVIRLDARGIACSTASSCRTLSEETYSYVIEAIGKKECASSSLRFTMGRGTTKRDLDKTLKAVEEITT